MASNGSDDDDEDHSLAATSKRRFSVCAEVYDPAQDEDSEEERICHPKTDEQRKDLMTAVEGILLFCNLDRQQMNDVIDAMFQKKVTVGETVITQGDEDARYFYVISNGSFDVFSDGKLTNKMVDKGCFGELALMYNKPRTATVKAKTTGSLWVMDRESFRRIVLHSAFIKRKLYDKFIDSVPLLSNMNDYQRVNLADALKTKKFNDGDVIIKEGEVADGMYFVVSGKVKITRTIDGIETVVACNDDNTFFGELALLYKSPRQATATAVGDVKLAFLGCERFERLMGPCMEDLKKHSSLYVKTII